MDKARISVVTVCKNAEKDIEYTINSILNQDYTDYEYLIKDGKSVDSTVEIAEKYRESFKAKNITYRIISEADKGIYDAMNKAAEYAEGEWIIYINAGDALFDHSVLAGLSAEISDRYDVIYGDAVLTENGKFKLLKAGSPNRFKYENPVCHQAALAKTSTVREYRFDTGFEIAADFDLFLRLYLADESRFKKMDVVVSIFLLQGISYNRVWKREIEFDSIRRKNGLKRVAFPYLQMIKIVLVERVIRGIAKMILGKRFYSKKRSWFADKHDAAGI